MALFVLCAILGGTMTLLRRTLTPYHMFAMLYRRNAQSTVLEEDKGKSAFSVPHGRYEFNVTPFGLCNVVALYQRMMDETFPGLPNDCILAYIDDIVIFNETFEDHLADIRHLFSRLQCSRISLKLSKCIFASDSVDFLGLELSRNGIKPQTRLIDAIRSHQQPSTRKKLRAFLELAGLYRAFTLDFPRISQPLNALTSDHAIYHWSKECEKAFNQLN